ncbi:alpha-tocopherol transfer protein-like [Haematobia irritans]|uniref:alpha-tocopherol transfer protein-like n=1 Tax=Haematobia irritans TaxID=7368 RepID=UPI003F4FDCBF
MAAIKPLPKELEKIAYKELGEVPDRISDDLEILKTWISQQPHLRARTDDEFLVKFLRGSKYSIEKAKQKIDMFYAYKTKYPELFVATDADEENFRKLHKTGFLSGLVKPANDIGPRVFLFRLNYSPEEFNVDELFRYSTTLYELYIMNDPYSGINGVIIVLDFAEATTGHIMPVSLNATKQFVTFYVDALPVRVKHILLINVPKFVQQFLNLLLPHLPEKIRSRVTICGSNIDEFGDKLPKKYLPKEYGGENGSVDQFPRVNEKLWNDNREYLKENLKYGSDESLRIGKPFNFNDDLGMGGTFRKLNVD